MTKRQEAILGMFDEVIKYSDTSITAVSTIPAYPVALGSFKNIVTEIKALDFLIKQSTKYFAANKDMLKKQLASEFANICKAVKAYGVAENVLDIVYQVDYTKTDLESMRDEELPQVLLNIWVIANHYVSGLSDYGITPDRLTALSDLIEAYNSSGSEPRNAIVKRKTNIQQLAEVFKRGNSLLKDRLDNLAAQITFETFYQGYKNARIIVDSATRSTKIDGVVVDVNGDPIAGVTISVRPFPRTFTGSSAADGSFLIKTPTVGQVNVLFEKAGFQTKQMPNVILLKGETTHLGNSVMIPEQQ